MARTLDDIADRGKDKKWEDDIAFADLPNGEYVESRIVGSVLPYAKHWIEFISKQTGKRATFPVDCPRFNPDTEAFDRPVLKDGKPRKNKKTGEVMLVPCACCDAGIKASPSCLLWIIDYRLVEEGSSKPIRAVRIPLGVVRDIKAMKQLNKVKNEKTGKSEPTSVMHDVNGCRISIKFDAGAKGPNKWSLNKGDRMPLTKKERKWIEALVDFDKIITFPDQGKVIADLKRHEYLNEDGSVNKDRESLDPRDQERKGGRDDSYSSKPKGKRSSVSSEDDGSEEDSEPKTKKGKKPTDSEDEPASEKKSKSKSKKDSEDDDDSEEDSEEDSEPKKKSKGSESKKGKKAKDSEDDSEADSEDDSEKPKSKKGKKDSEEDDDDLDSEDLPDPKKGKTVGKTAKKSSKDSEDSEDSEEEDSEEADSEDDSEKPKSKKSKKDKDSSEKKKSSKSKKKFDSEDD